MVAALAGALALAGVGADAVTFVSRIGRSRHGRTRQEEGGGSGGDSGTRLRCNFHDIPPKDVGNDSDAHQIAKVSWKFACGQIFGSNENDRRLTSCNPLDLSPLDYSSRTNYGRPAIWLQPFQKKSFFFLDRQPIYA